MFNSTLFNFILGWVLWFLIDKHPAALGTVLPEQMDDMLDNFQIAFDMLSAGYLSASYVFIWKAHYIILSIIFALVFSAILQSLSSIYRRHRLQQVMWPKNLSADSEEKQQAEKLKVSEESKKESTRG